MTGQAVNSVFEKISRQKVLIIGDVILDAYYHGRVDRISPEAPVSILDVDSKDYRLGGAANVALNVKGLGAQPILCSVIGNDAHGKKVIELLSEVGLKTIGVLSSEERITTVKSRLVSGNRQIMRVDEEQTDLLNRIDENALMDSIAQMVAAENPDAIIFEDYDKGVISHALITKVLEIARAKEIPVAVDPKKRNFLAYAGATLFKPNLKELREGLNNSNILPTEDSLQSAFEFLNDIMPVEMALFTLSSHGMFITNGTDNASIPTEANRIADVSGAGDTVIATATCALAAGADMTTIAHMANAAAGIVCKQPGVVAVERDELEKHLKHQ